MLSMEPTDTTTTTTLGQRISTSRVAAGFSQSGLARAMGVSTTYIQKVEKDEIKTPSIDKLRRFSEKLGISMSYILGDSREEEIARDGEAEEDEGTRLARRYMLPGEDLDEWAALFRRAARYGPDRVRRAIELLESLSPPPEQGDDLDDVKGYGSG